MATCSNCNGCDLIDLIIIYTQASWATVLPTPVNIHVQVQTQKIHKFIYLHIIPNTKLQNTHIAMYTLTIQNETYKHICIHIKNCIRKNSLIARQLGKLLATIISSGTHSIVLDQNFE